MLDSQQTWVAVQRFMQNACGLVVSDQQCYLLEARLRPVADKFKFSNVHEYVRAACAPNAATPLTSALIDAMTTHETFFFRDPTFWRSFEEKIVPQLPSLKAGRTLRIWSAACSTGQEPYTIAMILAERFPEVASRVVIYGTDVSEPAIEKARSGVYTSLEVNRGIGAPRLVKHFEQVPGGFRLKQELRQRITWTQHNLLATYTPIAACDVVLCRNVLIYFAKEDRDKVSNRLLGALTQGGFMGVGSTELIKGRQIATGWYSND